MGSNVMFSRRSSARKSLSSFWIDCAAGAAPRASAAQRPEEAHQVARDRSVALPLKEIRQSAGD